MIDNKTPALQMPLPHPSNLLGEDVERLAQALMMADEAFVSLRQAMDAAAQALQAQGLDLSRHGHSAATPTTPGFMAADDKKKLDGIAASANNYSHPATHPASVIEQNENARFFSDAERQKLAGIAAGANAYSHPATHPASVITQDAQNRFVTDVEKQSWSSRMAPGFAGLGGACQAVDSFNTTPDQSGFFMASNVPGAPTPTGWWLVQQLVLNPRWKTQLAFGMAGNDGQFLFRQGTDNGTTIVWGAWSSNMTTGVKSVQRGLYKIIGSTPISLTIAAVNLGKSFVNCTFREGSVVIAQDWARGGAPSTVRLTSATTLEIHNQSWSGQTHDTSSPWVSWEVIEFN